MEMSTGLLRRHFTPHERGIRPQIHILIQQPLEGPARRFRQEIALQVQRPERVGVADDQLTTCVVATRRHGEREREQQSQQTRAVSRGRSRDARGADHRPADTSGGPDDNPLRRPASSPPAARSRSRSTPVGRASLVSSPAHAADGLPVTSEDAQFRFGRGDRESAGDSLLKVKAIIQLLSACQ